MASLFVSRRGGIGRHARLKIVCRKTCRFKSDRRYYYMETFYDLLIAMLILVTAYPAVILLYNIYKRKNSWENKHIKITELVAALLLLGTLIIMYGSFIEPRIIITTYQTIKLNKFFQPLKVALISDLQIGTYKKDKYLNKVVDKITNLKPDIIFIDGDTVDNNERATGDLQYLYPLEKLAKLFPTYAVPGNHEYGFTRFDALEDLKYRQRDYSKETQKALEKMGIKYLVNQTEKITINNQSFCLFGGDEFWTGNLNFSALSNCQKNIPIFALIHNPTAVYQAANHHLNLMLSGHTHGGQIRLPFLGPLGRIDRTFPPDWYQGLNEHKGIKLYVTSGAGEAGVRARLFNPPEIVLLTIK